MANEKWIKQAAWIQLVMISGLMPLANVKAETPETLDLRAYLEATLQYHLEQHEYHVLDQAERLSLEDGQRYFWPKITARSSYDEVTSETFTVPTSRNVLSGITTGLDTSWTSWLGTDITLGLEHKYGRQLGKVSQGIPEDKLQVDNFSIEISQPLLKHNSPFYNRLPLLRAQKQWQLYHINGELGRLALLRSAMLDYLKVQESYDRLQIQKNRLKHIQSVADSVSVLVEEGRSLPIDRDLAQLDVRRQEQSIASARQVVHQNQYALTLPWVSSDNIQVVPLTSLTVLIDWLLPVLDELPLANHHPEYRKQQLNLEGAQLEERARQRDHWPELSAYYRFEKDFRERLPDEENQSWGLRFSYDFFDLHTREDQARLGAEASIARWNAEDQLKRLNWETKRLRQSSEASLAELELDNQVVELSQRAVAYELARYSEGLASYADVRNRQLDLLDRQLSAQDTSAKLARELIELAYNHQWDWLNRLP